MPTFKEMADEPEAPPLLKQMMSSAADPKSHATRFELWILAGGLVEEVKSLRARIADLEAQIGKPPAATKSEILRVMNRRRNV
jgi:hypothetical protein